MSRLRRSGIPRPALYKIVLVDMLVGIACVFMVLLFKPTWLMSLLTGLCIFLIPNLFFIWYAFDYRGTRDITQMARSFFRAEVVKYLLTVLLFAYSLMMLTVQEPAVVFVAYGLLWAGHQLAAYYVVGRDRI